MTINEQQRLTADQTTEAGTNTGVLSSSHALVDRLNAGEPYAVAFGGQGGAWLENLEELVSSAGIESELSAVVGEAALLLEPVARELVVVRPIGFEPLQWVRALAAEEPLPATKQLITAAISGPGILLTQMAAIRALTRQGLDLYNTPPVAMAGHSQGVMACESLRAKGTKDAELLALLAADRRGRLAGFPSPRHGRPGRQVADGVSHQRRPRPHGRAARGILHRRAHRAAARAVDPQRQALGGHHRHAGTAWPLRAVLQQDHREGRGRAQEQAARRLGLQPRVPRRTGRGRLPHPAAGRRRRGRRPLGRQVRHRRRDGTRDDRVDLRAPHRLGRRDRAAARLRREMDRRPRAQRHRHPPDRPRDPRTGRRHRSRGHPRRTAQPVHRRRRA